jgi:hypothetical protein
LNMHTKDSQVSSKPSHKCGTLCLETTTIDSILLLVLSCITFAQCLSKLQCLISSFLLSVTSMTEYRCPKRKLTSRLKPSFSLTMPSLCLSSRKFAQNLLNAENGNLRSILAFCMFLKLRRMRTKKMTGLVRSTQPMTSSRKLKILWQTKLLKSRAIAQKKSRLLTMLSRKLRKRSRK